MTRCLNVFLSICLVFCSCVLHAQIITTYAGNGIAGEILGDNGPALGAEIAYPFSVSFDNQGNLLICQYRLLRKVDKLTGIITTIAGSDTASSLGHGGDGGPATCAHIVEPRGVCVDVLGNAFIADAWYSEVRKVDVVTGIIDTFAGNRNPGNLGDGGPAKSAELANCYNVFFDTGHQYLYISDEFNYRIRRVNMSTNIISGYAGTGLLGYNGDGGLADTTMFGRLLGMCRDRDNNIYVGDYDNNRIRRIDAVTHIVTTYVGNGIDGYAGDGGPAIDARINRPGGLCFDKCGNLYFSMVDSYCVRRVDVNTRIVTTVAGDGILGFSGDNGPAVNARLFGPIGVAVDSQGNLFISDWGNNRIRKVTIYNPYIHITAAPNDTTSFGTPVTFSSTVSGGGDAPVFQWYVNGVAIAGATNGTYAYTPANGDSLSCTLTSNSQCVGTPTAYSNTIHMKVWPLDVPEINGWQQVSIFPNPAHNELTVTAANIMDITITNLLGEVLIGDHNLHVSTKRLNIAALHPGIYCVSVNGLLVDKLIKE